MMNKVIKKAWIEKISGETVALCGSVFGWTLEKVQNTLNGWDANAIKYTNGVINQGRKVKQVRSKDIIFQLADGTDSYLQTTGGEWYVHNCEAGEFMIGFFPAIDERNNSAVVYAVSNTGM